MINGQPSPPHTSIPLQAWWVAEELFADVWRVCVNNTNCTEIDTTFQGGYEADRRNVWLRPDASCRQEQVEEPEAEGPPSPPPTWQRGPRPCLLSFLAKKSLCSSPFLSFCSPLESSPCSSFIQASPLNRLRD